MASLLRFDSACAEGCSSRGPDHTTALALNLLLRRALTAMTSADDAVKETVLRFLMPVLGRTAGYLSGNLGECALQAIWEQCR